MPKKELFRSRPPALPATGAEATIIAVRSGEPVFELLKPDSLDGVTTPTEGQIPFIGTDGATFDNSTSLSWNNTDGILITGNGLQITEQTAVPGGAPAAGKGKLWIRDDTPNVLVFTDDTGTDTDLGGGGSVSGSGTINTLSKFTAADTIGDSLITDDGSILTFNVALKLQINGEPSDFTAATGPGLESYFKGQGAAAGSGDVGGGFVFEPGPGDGAGADAIFTIRQPGGIVGTDDLDLFHTGTDGNVRSMSGPLYLMCQTGQNIWFRNETNTAAVTIRTGGIWPDGANSRELGTGTWDLEYKALYLGWDAGSGVFFGDNQEARINWDSTITGMMLGSETVYTLAYRPSSVPNAFTAAADTDGADTYFRAQDGGTHTAADPRGGDFVFKMAAPGSGGGGRKGRFVLEGPTSVSRFNVYHDSVSAILDAENGLLSFRIANVQKMSINTNGNIALGDGQLADAATSGFPSIPTTTSGTPTGTPSGVVSGTVPVVYDDTNDILYVYNSSWKSIGGGGAAKPFLVFTAFDNVSPTTSVYPTLDIRNNHPVLDFDDSVAEFAAFESVLSPDYAGGGLTVEIYWTATSATTGDVKWSVAFERQDIGTDLDANSFAAYQTTTTTTSATNGALVKTTITFTDGAQMDSLAAGEAFRVEVVRDATNAADTMVGDAELLRVVVRET